MLLRRSFHVLKNHFFSGAGVSFPNWTLPGFSIPSVLVFFGFSGAGDGAGIDDSLGVSISPGFAVSSGVIFAGVGASLYSVFGACISPGFAVSSVSGFRISGLGFGGSGISSPQASGLSSTGSSGTGSTGSERELMYSVETHHLTFPVPPASVCAASTSTSTQICSSGVPLFLSLSTVACPAHTIFS